MVRWVLSGRTRVAVVYMWPLGSGYYILLEPHNNRMPHTRTPEQFKTGPPSSVETPTSGCGTGVAVRTLCYDREVGKIEVRICAMQAEPSTNIILRGFLYVCIYIYIYVYIYICKAEERA